MSDQPQENTQEQELDIESQLDALLARLEQLEPDLFKTQSSAQESPQQSVAHVAATETEPVSDDVAMTDQTPADDVAVDAQQVETDPQSPVETHDTADQIDALLKDQISDQIDQALETAVQNPDGADTSQPESSDPTAPPTTADEQPSSDLIASQIDQLLLQQPAEQVPATESSPESADEQPLDVAGAAVEDSAAATSSDADLAHQLQALLDSQDTQPQSESATAGEDLHDPPVQPGQVEAEVSADANPEAVQELSLEEIDQLLAEEADHSIEEAISDTQVQPAPAPEALTPETPVAELTGDDQADADAGAPVQRPPEPEPAIAAEQVSTDGATGGFIAGAGDVAKELDQQQPVESPVRSAMGVSIDEMDQVDQPLQPRLTFKVDRQKLAHIAAVIEEMLKRICLAINRPARHLPVFIRDAIGYVAVFNLFFGSLLLVGKMFGIV